MSLIPHHSLLGINEHDLMSQLTEFSSQDDEDASIDDLTGSDNVDSVDESWTTASDTGDLEDQETDLVVPGSPADNTEKLGESVATTDDTTLVHGEFLFGILSVLESDVLTQNNLVKLDS